MFRKRGFVRGSRPRVCLKLPSEQIRTKGDGGKQVIKVGGAPVCSLTGDSSIKNDQWVIPFQANVCTCFPEPIL